MDLNTVAKPVVSLESLREGLNPPPRPQIVRKVQCPLCYGTDVISTGTKERVRHYRCRRCVDEKTGDWTRFKVVIECPRVE